MKILVTGAHGFIGTHLVERLGDNGHDVEAFNQDITRLLKISSSYDVIVHLAAHNITHVGDSNSLIYQQVNVEGTKNLLAAVKSRRVIFISTTKVYRKTEGVITEESALDPQQAYEQSKKQAEDICLSFASKMEIVILRATNVFGPGQPQKAVIPIFFTQGMNAQRIHVFAPRKTWLQLLYVEDLVSAIECAVTAPQASGIFNVAPLDLVLLEDLARMIKSTCQSSSTIEFTNNSPEPRMEISYNKIQQQLGWKPTVTLVEGLRRYYHYVQKQSA